MSLLYHRFPCLSRVSLEENLSKSIRNGNIFCLESIWYEGTSYPRQSVVPVVGQVSLNSKVLFTHLNCNTKEEFVFNLKKFNRKFGIVYFGFHGDYGELLLNSGESVTLDELAKIMGHRFKRCGIHFASCKVLGSDLRLIERFIKKTEVSFVSGYEKSVYWIPSLAVDMVYLEALVYNTDNPEKAVETMKEYIVPSEKNIGFRFIY